MSFLISLKFSTLTNYIAASSWIILDPRDYTRVWKLLATVSNFWNFFPPSVDLYLEIQNVSSTAGNDERGIGERGANYPKIPTENERQRLSSVTDTESTTNYDGGADKADLL